MSDRDPSAAPDIDALHHRAVARARRVGAAMTAVSLVAFASTTSAGYGPFALVGLVLYGLLIALTVHAGAGRVRDPYLLLRAVALVGVACGSAFVLNAVIPWR